MRMSVFARVVMRMNRRAITFQMKMGMRAIANTAVNAPSRIGKAKADQCPCGEISAKGLERFELHDGDSERNTDQSEHDGAKHMPHPAGEGDPCRFDRTPLTRTIHHDERQVVIRPEQRVYKAKCRGGTA